MIKYIIEGHKWFDKINGNTYHAVNITDAKTNKLIFSSGLTYGYDEQWRYTALEALIGMKLWKKKDNTNFEKIRKQLYFNCEENAKKKDLNKIFNLE